MKENIMGARKEGKKGKKPKGKSDKQKPQQTSTPKQTASK
jgi:hypothetical protein